ncbi:MAG: hypothetical protein A2Z34_10850 [Planctomycetes bacterium RBG_16_59_8]|nr:MAG: hypothetical protein A2Z34_10850 [Planctomycetes bacterium RBG_16_59_8]
MVEFCNNCGSSLPIGDLTIRGGEVFTSYNYQCPGCREMANPHPSAALPDAADPVEEVDLIVRGGSVSPEGEAS